MLTKFVEGAREVEMDAVGKDGRVSALSPSPLSLPFHQFFFSLAILKHSQVRIHNFYETGLTTVEKLLSQKKKN